MPIDFSEQPGYGGASSKPPSFSDPDLREWTGNLFHNARSAAELRSDGFIDLLTLHPVRAMPLLGTTDVIPGDPYAPFGGGFSPTIQFRDDPSFSLPYADLPLGGPAIPPAPGNVPQSAVDPIIITVRSMADYSGSRSGKLLVNNEIINADVFRTGSGAIRTEAVEISKSLWNFFVGENDGYITLAFTAGVSSGDWVQFSVSYSSQDTLHQPHVHKEVCLPNRGFWMRRGDGFAQPAMIYQPDREEEPMLSIGQGWIVGDDEPDDVGIPGMTVLGTPMETPPTIEAIFSAYPAVCPGAGTP